MAGPCSPLNLLPLASCGPATLISLFPMVLPPLAFICTIPSFRNAWNPWNVIYPHTLQLGVSYSSIKFQSIHGVRSLPIPMTKRDFLIVSKTHFILFHHKFFLSLQDSLIPWTITREKGLRLPDSLLYPQASKPARYLGNTQTYTQTYNLLHK